MPDALAPSPKSQSHEVIAPSGSRAREPSNRTSSIHPDQAIRAGIGDRRCVGDHVVLRRRDVAFAGGGIGLDRQPDHVGAGLLVGVLDRGPLGGAAVAEVPAPALDPSGRAGRLAGIEGGARADRDRARTDDLCDRRLDHPDGHLVGVGVVALARLVALDAQHHAVVAGQAVDVDWSIAAAGDAVAEVPGKAIDHAVEIARAGAVEVHLGAGADLLVGSGLGDRRFVDLDHDPVGVAVVGESGLVLDRQRDRIKGARVVGLGGIDQVRRGAVTEVPVIAQQAAIRVARGAAIEHHDVAGADLLVAARHRDRRAVDRYGDRGGRGGVPEACAVVDRQHDGVAAALGIAVGDHRPSASRRAVAEVPAIGQGIAVGVRGGRAVERDGGVRGDDVRSRRGDRRVVDADLDLVAIDRVDRAAVVGHRQLGGIDPLATRRTAPPRG